jgi:predicted GNAT superfamily acetyltransferase
MRITSPQPEPARISSVDVVGSLSASLLALNNAHSVELGSLNEERLRHIVAQAFLAARIGRVDALVLALDQDADYDSPNYVWFRSRFERFVYIDRVVVASQARGRGLARRLYNEVFEHAARAGHDRVTCEVNSHPPNPQSDAFHAALGFAQVGAGSTHGGAKFVRYLVRDLASGEPRLVARSQPPH